MNVPLSKCAPLFPSQHLVLQRMPKHGAIAYHALFGNLTWIDSDVCEFFGRAVHPLSFETVVSELGTEIANAFVNSYFLVPSFDEERSLISEWLEERESLIETGHYLGALQISSSNACNFTCAYCFADAADSRSGVRQTIARGPQNISYELACSAIQQALDIAMENGRERIAVKFLGREPLLNWKVMKKLLSTFDDGRVVWAITTNGSLLKSEIITELKRHRVHTIISLDGPPSVNDQLRVLKGSGGGTYAAVEKALESMAAHGCPFGVSSVVSSAVDFGVMRPFVDRLVELGTQELELTLVMQTNDLRAQAAVADEEELASELVRLYEYVQKSGLMVHGDWLEPFHRICATHKFRDEPRITRPPSSGCTATSHQISLEPSGDVFPCRAMSMHYGRIDDLRSILRSDDYRKVLMRTYCNVPFCRGCELEGSCQGTCLGSLEEAGLDIYNPQEEYCRIYRLTTQKLLETLENPLESELHSQSQGTGAPVLSTMEV